MAKPPCLSPGPEDTAMVACYARYGSDTAVAQYCDAHFGPDKFGVPNFLRQLVQLCGSASTDTPQRRALDLGCAVGRASFELATRFEQVIGLDYSSRFIGIAKRLKERGRVTYRLPVEGEIVVDRKVDLAELGLAATASRVTFLQGNAQRLDAHLADFDLVLAANLIDRLPDPGKFLAGIHQLLVIGGLLAVASPYTWLEEFTPRRQWLGGGFRAGRPLTCLGRMSEILLMNFAPAGAPQEVEFVIRETARNFQHSISQLTLWRRIR